MAHEEGEQCPHPFAFQVAVGDGLAVAGQCEGTEHGDLGVVCRRGRHGREQRLGELGSRRSRRGLGAHGIAAPGSESLEQRRALGPAGRLEAERQLDGEPVVQPAPHARHVAQIELVEAPAYLVGAAVAEVWVTRPVPERDHRPGERACLSNVTTEFGCIPATASRGDQHIGQRQATAPRPPVDPAVKAIGGDGPLEQVGGCRFVTGGHEHRRLR